MAATSDSKEILKEIQHIFSEDKGWDSEEEMLSDMAEFRKERIEIIGQ